MAGGRLALGLRCSSSFWGLVLPHPHSRWAQTGGTHQLGQKGQGQPSPKLTLHPPSHSHVSLRPYFPPPKNTCHPRGAPSPPPPLLVWDTDGHGARTWTRSGVRRLARSHFWKRCVRRRARSRLQVLVFSREVQMRLSARSWRYLEVSRVMSTIRQLLASSV